MDVIRKPILQFLQSFILDSASRIFLILSNYEFCSPVVKKDFNSNYCLNGSLMWQRLIKLRYCHYNQVFIVRINVTSQKCGWQLSEFNQKWPNSKKVIKIEAYSKSSTSSRESKEN